MLSNTDDEFIMESGIAKGIDALVKYKGKKLYIWAVYSYGVITRNDGDRTYSPHFDRRHNINFVTSYKFGRKESWKTDLRWNLGSGFPFTQNNYIYATDMQHGLFVFEFEPIPLFNTITLSDISKFLVFIYVISPLTSKLPRIIVSPVMSNIFSGADVPIPTFPLPETRK